MILPYHFPESDFARCNPPCKGSDLNPELLDRLEYARSLCGRSFRITSAFRNEVWEIEHGRVGTSSHCRGLAVDIACQGEELRFLMVQSLLRAGFTRIGIADAFIHADIDRSKKPCIWLY